MLLGVSFDVDGSLLPTSQRQMEWFQFWGRHTDSRLSGVDVNPLLYTFGSVGEFLDFYNPLCAKEGGVQNVYDALGLACNMSDRKHPVWAAYEEFNELHPVEPYEGIVKAIEEVWQNTRLGSQYMEENHPERYIALRFALNTTNSWRSIKKSMVNAGLMKFFDTKVTEEVLRLMHGYDSDPIKKPSGLPMAITTGALNSGGWIMHFGDTIADLVSARSMMLPDFPRYVKIRTVGLAWGYESRATLEQGVTVHGRHVHFDTIIDKPSQIPQLIYDVL